MNAEGSDEDSAEHGSIAPEEGAMTCQLAWPHLRDGGRENGLVKAGVNLQGGQLA